MKPMPARQPKQPAGLSTIQAKLGPIRVKIPRPRPPARSFLSPFLLIYGEAALVLIGTILLLLPISNVNGAMTPPLVALFTATSAATVTGLTVVDSATYWTPFGQIVIMGLIFLGGLGLMTAATFLLIVVGQRITLSARLALKETMGVSALGGIVRFTRNMVIVVILAQVLGFLVLLPYMLKQFPGSDGVVQTSFQTVSAFNNAGFDILPSPDSLVGYRTHIYLLSVTAVLIILGSVGYAPLADLIRRRRWNRLTLDTKLVWLTNLILWGLAALVIFFLEYRNSATLGGLSLGHQVANSAFEAVSTRTAGFDSVNFASTHTATNFFYMAFMFIGGTTASAAGGIKVTTIAVLVVAAIASLRGSPYIQVFGREIPYAAVMRAITVAIVGIFVVFGFAVVITLLTPGPTSGITFEMILFDTVSAFATTGLSTGIPPLLTEPAQVMLAIAMFVGRIGPLTLVLAAIQREQRPLYRYAEESVRIG